MAQDWLIDSVVREVLDRFRQTLGISKGYDAELASMRVALSDTFKNRVRKQTSAKVSTTAARYMSIEASELWKALEENPQEVVAEIRSMAASCVVQDETPGQAR